eukprot:TRINITY_DN9533_c0_g1_i1.p1 TRINITY_DN9533_c0_g1~~TRINITY_DN9533_c0_g1_i1.p1  ORF type:complete len:595 (-),score=102.03 TRINITY_DN9533_c0_g1_i1:110-1894(-)
MSWRRGLIVGTGFGVLGASLLASSEFRESMPLHLPITTGHPTMQSPPTRDRQIARLKEASTKSKAFDILIIGGGATGTGVALDAATRGLNCALVERFDFASGTSSRSTKLVHGGVRYLEKAVLNLDKVELHLVYEALHERAVILSNAPHLTNALPIMTPMYAWWKIPYYWAGAKMYDLVAGSGKLYRSHFMTREETLSRFPMMGKANLKGAVVYYDGQMNDSRLCVSIAMTAASMGAAIANYVEVTKLLLDENGKLCGATVKDNVTNETWDVYAKVVVNATGCFSDSVISMGENQTKPIVQTSAGVHIILPNYYSPDSTGLIVPETRDGRVMFLLPWEGMTLAGTTDDPCDLTPYPYPRENDIEAILKEISGYLGIPVRREDVKSAWSGIRPLARDPNSKNTAQVSRNHVVYVHPNQMVTVVGGKWTTYRQMAQDTLDKAIEVGSFKNVYPCTTSTLKLIGAHQYDLALFTKLAQMYGLETNIAQHLSKYYGDRAVMVADLYRNGYSKRLSPLYPYVEAEVLYVVDHEYALTPVDVLAHRTRLAFLDQREAVKALPRVVELMAERLGWDEARKAKETENALHFLRTMAPVDAGY